MPLGVSVQHDCHQSHYGHASAMLDAGHSEKPVMFFLFFSAPNLQGRSVDHRQIVTRSMVTRIYKIGSGILSKLTICPEFFGTVPNFQGLSQKNNRSFGTLNCPEF